MSKHIIGLTLFSFIVSATAIVYVVFNVPKTNPTSEKFTISVSEYVPSERTHCKMKRQSKIDSLEIRQAVFNAHSKQFEWEITTPGEESIVLHFFSKNARGTQYIASEIAAYTHSPDTKRFGISYNWLSERESYENLYVIAEHLSETIKSGNYPAGYKFQPKFDAAKAVPVTIDYGS